MIVQNLVIDGGFMQPVKRTYEYNGKKLFDYYGKAVFNIYEFYTGCEFYAAHLKRFSGNVTQIRLKKANPGRSDVSIKRERHTLWQTTVEKMKGEGD